MKALTAANALMSGTNAVNSVMDGATGNLSDKVGGVSVNISLGGSTSESSSTQTHSTAQGSSVTAGGNINIVAKATDEDEHHSEHGSDESDKSLSTNKRGNITLQGSNIKAGNNTTLEADNDINLLAAKSTADQHSTNSSSSGSIGVGVSLNSKGGGLTGTASASAARGNADGSDVTWTNTHVDAGNTLTLKSGRDTNMKGAVASGKQVVADIGGNLNIESLQDTSTYDSKQISRGGSLSVAIIGSGSGGSVNAADTKINSNYASVMEQSGIKAGDGGFKVNVKGNTDLKGAVIAASDEGLALSTFKTGGTLTQSDIQNSASYDAEAVAVSAGVGSKASAGAGIGEDSGNASATTKSGIGVSTKTDTTGAIAKIFDANKVTEEVNAQVQITQTFSQLAPKAVGDYAETKLREARDKLATARDQNNGLNETERAQLIMDAKALDDNWGEGGNARVALHTVVGALGGGLEGALGAGTTAVSTPAIAEAINKLDVPNEVKQSLIMAAGTAVGAAAGGNAGAASGLGEVANNYLTHQQSDEKKKALEKCKSISECEAVNEKFGKLDKQQKLEAQTCLANGKCDSVMMTDNDIKQARDELQAACAVFCTADKLASLNELNNYFLPNGEVNQDALRTGQIDWGKLTKAGIGLAGGVAGVATGAILVEAGGALVLAPEPTGISKLAGAATATVGAATLADAGYGVYSNTVNLYRATQGSVVYLPDSGLGWFAETVAPGNQAAQDIAQIGSLSLALASGRVYVGTAPAYADSAFSQYVPTGINGMLDANAVTSPGVRSGLFITDTKPGTSTASWLLDTVQKAQMISLIPEYVPRLYEATTTGNTK